MVWKEAVVAQFEVANYPYVCLEGLSSAKLQLRQRVFGPRDEFGTDHIRRKMLSTRLQRSVRPSRETVAKMVTKFPVFNGTPRFGYFLTEMWHKFHSESRCNIAKSVVHNETSETVVMNRNLFMRHDGTRNQEQLCWRGPCSAPNARGPIPSSNEKPVGQHITKKKNKFIHQQTPTTAPVLMQAFLVPTYWINIRAFKFPTEQK
jgi:hypothetical protein